MPLTTDIHVGIVGRYTRTDDLGAALATVQAVLAPSLDSGTLNTQADKIFGDTRTIALSSSEDLDLFGTLLDAFGVLFSPVEIVAMLITASAANTNNVVVGATAATQFVGPFGAATHTITIKPGGCFLWYSPAGFANAAGSDLLKIANSGAGTSVDYSIVIVGRSA